MDTNPNQQPPKPLGFLYSWWRDIPPLSWIKKTASSEPKFFRLYVIAILIPVVLLGILLVVNIFFASQYKVTLK
jgi:hypothetical protein